MKKTLFCAAIVAIAFGMTSCKNTKQEPANDTEQKADSTVVVEEKAEPESEYKSLDLNCLNLRGHVSEVKTYKEKNPDYSDFLAFDEQGRLYKMTTYAFEGPVVVTFKYRDATSFEGDFVDDQEEYSRQVLERDDQHRIIFYGTKGIVYGEGCQWKTREDGGWEDSTTFTVQQFDEQGNIVKETFEGCGEGMEWSGESTYEYLETDAQGNWTKRKCIEKISEYDFGEKPGKYDKYETIEIREIKYRR